MPRRSAARAAFTALAAGVLLATSAATTPVSASTDESRPSTVPEGLVEHSDALSHAPGLSNPLGRKWQ
ncbi:MAG: hypothetical protein M3P93_00715 [Actinomycetota bacterium]|jgi:hypothetical protein|nr:hypothetical protein [Actinomycetota bacterium]